MGVTGMNLSKPGLAGRGYGMSETLVCVSDDVGVRVWLERVLESMWTLESVTSSDLSRVSRLVQATGARVVIVAVNEDNPLKSLKIFSAIQKACPSVQLVGVAQRISQEMLLSIMRAGARDCLLTGVDTDTAGGRIRRIAETAALTTIRDTREPRGNVTMIVPASPVVDSRFLAQNLAVEITQAYPDDTVLAIDSQAGENRTFYFDNLNRLTLDELVGRVDTIDRSFIDAALEEYMPRLRLLSGSLNQEVLSGDAGADLFIMLGQLAELFDHVIVRVDFSQIESWTKAIGADVTRIVLVANPVVEQAQYGETLLKNMREWVGPSCRYSLVIDGVEKRASLSVADIEKTVGLDCDLALPMEWKSRLEAMNAGLPMSLLPSSTWYQKKLGIFVRKTFSIKVDRRVLGKFFQRKAGAA